MKITVLYEGPLDMELDKEIQKAMESIGCKWYAQGTDFPTMIRNIAFDLER